MTQKTSIGNHGLMSKNNEVVNRYLYDNKLKSMLTHDQKEEVKAYKALHNKNMK